ncbi:LuxR C-terminal-related transcriptional regulator [Roseivirga sp. BDSF3-8]|uniref:LuxR C-terminal-related transcriptional regulator n=1 Tax=Roseivirga sp. BDSF3-8 TaxID=3241598 RepID=UPI003531FEAA
MKSAVIADAQPVFITGLKAILQEQEGITVVAEPDDAASLQDCLATGDIALVMMDYNQPGAFSRADVQVIRKSYPKLPVLVFSSDTDRATIMQVLSYGVSGYLTKDCGEEEVRWAVEMVLKGKKAFCSKILDLLLEQSIQAGTPDRCLPTCLTRREGEITALIAEGKSAKEIAAQLYLSVHTVRTHKKNIMKKMNVRSNTELIKALLKGE